MGAKYNDMGKVYHNILQKTEGERGGGERTLFDSKENKNKHSD
jgi:hypothetical protein